jgi:DNA-binding transcriptional LysR family regulator
MTLTAPGTRLQSYAQRLMALEAEARAAVRDDGDVRGTLRVGSMETTAALRLPDVLGRFHRSYPEVQLEVRTGPTAELLEHVLAHRLDCALVAGPIHHPDLAARAVFQEELVWSPRATAAASVIGWRGAGSRPSSSGRDAHTVNDWKRSSRRVVGCLFGDSSSVR